MFGSKIPTSVKELLVQFKINAGLSTEKRYRALRGKFVKLQATDLHVSVLSPQLNQGTISISTFIVKLCDKLDKKPDIDKPKPKAGKEGGKKRGKKQDKEKAKGSTSVVPEKAFRLLTTHLKDAKVNFALDYFAVITHAEKVLGNLSEILLTRSDSSQASTSKTEPTTSVYNILKKVDQQCG